MSWLREASDVIAHLQSRFTAVSYTHLDVYKRQVVCLYMFWIFIQLFLGVFFLYFIENISLNSSTYSFWFPLISAFRRILQRLIVLVLFILNYKFLFVHAVASTLTFILYLVVAVLFYDLDSLCQIGINIMYVYRPNWHIECKSYHKMVDKNCTHWNCKENVLIFEEPAPMRLELSLIHI